MGRVSGGDGKGTVWETGPGIECVDVSMDKTLVGLIHAGTISYDEARNYAVDIDELDRLMRD